MTTAKIDPASLVPAHLLEEVSATELKAAAEKQVAPEPAADSKKEAMRSRTYTFAFSYEDGNKKTWTGTFTSKVPDMRGKQAIGVMRAQLTGGIAFDALDPKTKEVSLLVATLSFCLLEKGRPAWAQDLMSITDVNLLRALYEEVAQHEATFLGL